MLPRTFISRIAHGWMFLTHLPETLTGMLWTKSLCFWRRLVVDGCHRTWKRWFKRQRYIPWVRRFLSSRLPVVCKPGSLWRAKESLIRKTGLHPYQVGFPRQQKYGIINWSGDIGGTWDTYKRQIVAGLNYTITGLPYWTTDIGGFFRPGKSQYTDEKYQELLTRWYQWEPLIPSSGYMAFKPRPNPGNSDSRLRITWGKCLTSVTVYYLTFIRKPGKLHITDRPWCVRWRWTLMVILQHWSNPLNICSAKPCLLHRSPNPMLRSGMSTCLNRRPGMISGPGKNLKEARQ